MLDAENYLNGFIGLKLTKLVENLLVILVTMTTNNKSDVCIGYSHFTETVKNKMLNFLLTYQCNGVAVLESRYNSQHTGAGYDFFLILGNPVNFCLLLIIF